MCVRYVRSVLRRSSGGRPRPIPARFRARREAALGFQVSGRVQKRLVEVGDPVKAGTPLFELDPADQSLSVKAAQADVDSTRAQLAQAQSEYTRYASLLKDNYVSRDDYERKRLALRSAEQSSRAALANYGLVSNQARYTTLHSSAAGVVTSISAESGQVVQAGQTVAKIAQDGERELMISIPESRVGELRSAETLTITLWAAPERRYTGRLRELAPDTDSVTRTYSARVTLVDADAQVSLGMTGTLLLSLPELPGNFRRVPLTALYDSDGTPKVWVVDSKSSRVTARPVTIARTQRNGVLVSGGLEDGDIVVTAGVNLLHEGQKVRSVDAADMPRPKT